MKSIFYILGCLMMFVLGFVFLKLLIDKGLNKTDLQRLTGISSATITKLSKNETVNTGILLKICTALKCDTSYIMSVVDVEDSISARTRL